MNISFLDPVYLWGLPLAAIPLLLHLLSKRTPQKLPFSDHRYILQAIERVRTSLRFYHYLILLLRTLIIALIVGYFAKPVYQPAAAGLKAGSEPAPVIFILDTSYSMGAKVNGITRFDMCKKLAQDSLAIVPKGTRAGVIAVSNRLEVVSGVLTNDTDTLARLITDIQLSNRPTDLAPAWTALRKMLENYHGARPVAVVLTDGAQHVFSGQPPEGSLSVRVVLPRFPSLPNRWLTEPSVTFNEGPEQWECSAAAQSSHYPVDTTFIELHADGRKVASDIGKPGTDGVLKAHMVWTAKTPVSRGTLTIPPDPLICDNEYYLTARRAVPFKTWLIDGDPRLGGTGSKTLYLSKLFPRAEVLRESDSSLVEYGLPGTVILANVREFSPALADHIRSGGGCIVFLGDRFEPGAEPEWFPAEVGNELDSPQSITWKDAGHPIAAEIAVKEYVWKNIHVDKGFVLSAKPGARVLAELGNGRPYLIEGKYGAGKVLLCCSGPDRDWGNIVAHPVFVTLLRAAARYTAVAAGQDAAADTVVGGTFHWKMVDDPRIARPDGKLVTAPVAEGAITYTDMDVPGMYALLSGRRTVTTWAVNLDNAHAESDLTAATLKTVRAYFKEMPLAMIEPGQWQKKLRVIIAGSDVSRQWLFAVLLLLLMELLLVTKGKTNVRR